MLCQVMCGGTIERHFSCILVFNYYLLLYFAQIVIKFTSHQGSNTLFYIDLHIDYTEFLVVLLLQPIFQIQNFYGEFFSSWSDQLQASKFVSWKCQTILELCLFYCHFFHISLSCATPKKICRVVIRLLLLDINHTIHVFFYRFKYTETRLEHQFDALAWSING